VLGEMEGRGVWVVMVWGLKVGVGEGEDEI
jgi:hypothetical protein